MGVYHTLRGGFKDLMKEFRESVTIVHITGETVDDDTVVTTTTTSVDTYAIVYHFKDEYSKYSFGEMPQGDITFLFNPSETVEVRDTITHKSKNYKVTTMESFDTKGGIVCKTTTCTEV